MSGDLQEALDSPLDPKLVKKRQGGGGKQLSYLEGHEVIRQANRIFGYGGWSMEAVEVVHLGTEPFTTAAGKTGIRVGYRALVRAWVGSLDASYTDTGYGDAMEYSGSELTPHELASKEAVTDGLKRCLMHLGDQFGLCLYDKDAPEHRGGVSTRHTAPQSLPGGSTQERSDGKKAPVAAKSVAEWNSLMQEIGLDPAVATPYLLTFYAVGETKDLDAEKKKDALARVNEAYLALADPERLTGAEFALGIIEEGRVAAALSHAFDGLVI